MSSDLLAIVSHGFFTAGGGGGTISVLPSIFGFRKTVRLRRRNVGAWLKGVYTEGSSEDMDILASIQPMNSGERMRLLPEARRQSESAVVYTTVELHAANPPKQINADSIIMEDGSEFEVLSVEAWPYGGLAHFKAVISKVVA